MSAALLLAERTGFEPAEGFRPHYLSKVAPSTAQPSLRNGAIIAQLVDFGNTRTVTLLYTPHLAQEERTCHNERMKNTKTMWLVGVGVAVLALSAIFVMLLPWFSERGKLTVAVSRLEATALVRIAHDQGYFDVHGLNVELIEDDLGKFSLKRVLDGEAHLATTAEFPVVGQSFKRDDVRVLATIHRADRNIHVLGRVDAGIQRAEDLEGKRIATTVGTVGEYFLHKLLKRHDVDPEDVEIINLTPQQIIQALDQRTIDGFSLREPHVHKTALRLGDDAVVFPGDDEAPVYTATFNIVATQKSLRGKRAEVRKFLSALRDAQDFLQRDPEGVRAILVEQLDLDAEYLELTWDDSDFSLGLDAELPTMMAEEGLWRIDQGLTDSIILPDMYKLIDQTPLERVNPCCVEL